MENMAVADNECETCGAATDQEVSDWERRCDEMQRERNDLFDAIAAVLEGKQGSFQKMYQAWERVAFKVEASR